MSEIGNLVLACLAGLLLGAVFFGGLWWTIQKGISSPWPELWFAGSPILRTCIVVAGFYFVSRGHWQRLLLCLLGFIVARVAVTWLTRPSKGVIHAPNL